MTILLAGFLGSYLLKSFIDSKFKVVALKRSSSNTYRINEHLNQVTLYDIDKCNLEEIFKNQRIDIVTNYGRRNFRY